MSPLHKAIWDQMTPEFLKQLVKYDPQTGILTWRPRWPDLFSSGRASPKNALRARALVCADWNRRYAGRPVFAINSQGYLCGCFLGRAMKAHRLIWFMHTGEWADLLDHINRDRTDNRLSNLRSVSYSLNARNREGSVSFDDSDLGIRITNCGSFTASVWRHRRVIHLGTWPTRAEAVAARNAARFVLAKLKSLDEPAQNNPKLNEPAVPATDGRFCARSDVQAAPGTLVASPAHGEAK